MDAVSSPSSFVLCAVDKLAAVRNAKNVAHLAVRNAKNVAHLAVMMTFMMTFVKNIVSA